MKQRVLSAANMLIIP